MRYRTSPMALILVCCLAISADASPASDVLFRGTKIVLPARDKDAIAAKLGFKLSKDRKGFVDDEGREVSTTVRALELNGDTTPEVLVILGSAALFGAAGSAVVLYVKRRGTYESNLGFPAADVEVLPARTRGYRHLRISGPGFECPVWKWNGRDYTFSHKVKC